MLKFDINVQHMHLVFTVMFILQKYTSNFILLYSSFKLRVREVSNATIKIKTQPKTIDLYR